MKKMLLKIVLGVLLAAVLASAVSAVVCSRELKVTEYDVRIDGLTSPARVVVISDLHSREYGEDNSALLALIAAQHPDAVFAVGDMINRSADEEDILQFLELLVKLQEIAPVYYSPGNHESDYMTDRDSGLLGRVSATGVTVLLDEYVETQLGGSTVRIGGTMGHYYRYEWSEEQKNDPPDYAMQEEIGSTDVPSIVLMHMPENMIADSARKNWNADLYISGHTHGGVVRLPLIGGLVAPTQGLFPKYDQGFFTVDGRLKLIITSGLAGYGPIPRIFNRPEICVIDMK
ncbi:MAG: metallophosphoesterase [Oscillospiraceae bacterium]